MNDIHYRVPLDKLKYTRNISEMMNSRKQAQYRLESSWMDT